MRRVGLVLPVLALVLAGCLQVPAQVTHVVDGDTVDVTVMGPDPGNLLVAGAGYRVRLIGIDTPEVYARQNEIAVLQERLNQIRGKGNTLLEEKLERQIRELEQPECFGAEASAYVKSLLEGRAVMLERDVSNTDRYVTGGGMPGGARRLSSEVPRYFLWTTIWPPPRSPSARYVGLDQSAVPVQMRMVNLSTPFVLAPSKACTRKRYPGTPFKVPVPSNIAWVALTVTQS
jgi:hypothetical protein